MKKNIYKKYGDRMAYFVPDGKCPLPDGVQNEAEQFRHFILQDAYPCVGARAAINARTYSLGYFSEMESTETPHKLAYGLMEFIREMERKPSLYLTYIALFACDRFSGEADFEMGLWQLLSRLHMIDAEHYGWAEGISSNPDNKNFSFSFGERAFFLVGMHPGSSRPARRFKYPAIAFNFHEQFEALREKGRYATMKKVIRKNELFFSGSVNPMLQDFGHGLEAPQYSGRVVDADWECPFQKKDGHDE
jgi:uncharacterized protein